MYAYVCFCIVCVCVSQPEVSGRPRPRRPLTLPPADWHHGNRKIQPTKQEMQPGHAVCVCVCMHAHSSYHLLRWVSRTCLSCQLLIMHVVLGLVRAHSLLQSCCTRPNVYVYESEHICISVHSDVVFSSIT